METIDLKSLTPEQLAELEEQIAAKKRAEKDRIAQEKENYKSMVKAAVREGLHELMQVNNMLSLAKAKIFSDFASIIALKHELFGIKSGQQSHTFTDEEGSITIGFRILVRYDDTLGTGIAYVRKYLRSLAKDEDSAELVENLETLLRQDANGNLKPNRVLELQAISEKRNNDNLTKGVDIIRKSYKPVRSIIFVEAEIIDKQGKKQTIPLSISSADFPEGFEPDFEVFK